jgi:hypothetical protein
MEPEPDATADVVRTGLTLASFINHLSKNRIEYAVFTLLVYSLGLADKVFAYGQNICV